jgi:tetratricopeptide (TPR) repeat protein
MSLDHKGYADKCKAAYERTIELARAQGARKALGAALFATAQLVDYWPDYRPQAMAHLEEARLIAEETGDEELQIDVASARTSVFGQTLEDAEALLQRLVARRDPIRLNAHYFRMMWFTLGAGKPERCLEICDAGIELAYRIGTLPVQYPTIKALALMELGRFGDAWAALDAEIADPAHRFGAALADLGRMQYEIHVGDHDAALARAPRVIAESHALVRAWMLRWTASALASFAPLFAGEPDVLDRIDALIATTESPPTAIDQAALALGRRDTAAARAAIAQQTGRGAPTLNVNLAVLQLTAEIKAADGQWVPAREAAVAAVALARERHSQNFLWRLLGEQAIIEAALGHNETSDKTRAEATALLDEIAATVPDARQRDGLLRGRLGKALGLAT